MNADANASIEALTASTEALLHTISPLTDEQAHEPSLMPKWSRGHVLTHVARNADALVNLLTWARTGVETPMYPSREKRDADIDAGSGRLASELIDDVVSSNARFLAATEKMSADQWGTVIRWGAAGRAGPAGAVPHLRRTEVEVHHVDLDLDYTVAHWPEDFVESLLAETVADYSGRDGIPGFVLAGLEEEGRWTVGAGGLEITGPPPALLGWLIGRSAGTGLHTDGSLPELEVWR